MQKPKLAEVPYSSPLTRAELLLILLTHAGLSEPPELVEIYKLALEELYPIERLWDLPLVQGVAPELQNDMFDFQVKVFRAALAEAMLFVREVHTQYTAKKFRDMVGYPKK